MLKSHIFVKQKRDGKIKARKVIGGNKQCNYITKEDVSSLTVSAEAVMLTCIIDAAEDRILQWLISQMHLLKLWSVRKMQSTV